MHEIFISTFAVFLLCKLNGTIDWNWGWVTAPIWIELLVVIFIHRNVEIEQIEEEEDE